jgi:ribosomal-protein-alanine N-acetyltransferase
MSPKRDTDATSAENGIKIRPFRIMDLARIMEIERRAFPDAWDESWFLYFFQTNPSGFMVAVEDKDIVVGYAIVDIESEAEGAWLFMEGSRLPPQRGHLLNIAVDENWRGKGIGSILLEEVDKYVLERAAKDLFLEVQTTNTDARRFYKKRGFKETGKVLRDYYPDGGDAILMKKKLLRQKGDLKSPIQKHAA